MPTDVESFRLNTGARIPSIGLGTWQSGRNQAGNAVRVALDAGYRHLDLAAAYGNELEIGAAIKSWLESNPSVSRSDLFITSKLWNSKHRPDLVAPAYADTLANLQLDYLDLYLIHFPVAFIPDTEPRTGNSRVDRSVTLMDTWKAMEQLYLAKKVKAIGVSNFNKATLMYFIETATVKPAVNQIELHPYLPQHELLAAAVELGVHVTAYGPLGSADTSKHVLREDPVVISIAKKHHVSVAQVCIAWGVQRGTSVTPKSVTPERIRVNIDPVTLDANDLAQLAELGKVNHRFCDPSIVFGADLFSEDCVD